MYSPFIVLILLVTPMGSVLTALFFNEPAFFIIYLEFMEDLELTFLLLGNDPIIRALKILIYALTGR